MSRKEINKMSERDLRDFCCDVRHRIDWGFASVDLIKLWIYAIKLYEQKYNQETSK